MRRNIEILGWTMIWLGVFLFGYVGWQLFGTDLVNGQVQENAQVELAESFEDARLAAPEPDLVTVEIPGTDDDPPVVAYYSEEVPRQSVSFAAIRIPKIDVDAVVFEGVDRETLTKGPGHMPETVLPGQPGNSVISGHRTTHGRPFYDFDRLVLGDRIEVETAVGIHVYEVRETLIVDPWDVWVAGPREGAWLTLTTCNPKFSARERLVVFAELVDGPNIDYVNALAGKLDEIRRSVELGHRFG